jgi:hypothetical protein
MIWKPREINLNPQQFLLFLFFLTTSLLSYDCGSSGTATISPRPEVPKEKPAPVFTAPDGWTITADSTTNNSIVLQLERTDHSADMVLKELHLLGEAQKTLPEENICVAGNISLTMKLANENDSIRVLRTPAPVDDSTESCYYTYIYHFLMRRVVVFRIGSRFYELELRQMTQDEPFMPCAEDQDDVVRSFMQK